MENASENYMKYLKEIGAYKKPSNSGTKKLKTIKMSNITRADKVLFIYVKDAKAKALYLAEAYSQEAKLKEDGWLHIETIDPRLFLENYFTRKTDYVTYSKGSGTPEVGEDAPLIDLELEQQFKRK